MSQLFAVLSAADTRAPQVLEQAATLGLRVAAARVADLYWVDGLDPTVAERLLREVVLDPVVDVLQRVDYLDNQDSDRHALDVALLPGVTDSRAAALTEAAALVGLAAPSLRVATGRRYILQAPADAVAALATALLANPVIERWAIDGILPPAFVEAIDAPPPPEPIDLTRDEAGLLALSAARRLALDLPEMAAIAAHYRALGRPATDVELEMFAQTWSEHCVHKTFRAHIVATEIDREGLTTTTSIDGLLPTWLQRATTLIAAPWVRSAFIDNAGIVAWTDTHDLAIKVETHNHPSALEPFGGANTGVGGVVRDLIGVSARPVANLDVLCFAPPEAPVTDALHPRRIRDGVIHGIEDYGNKMGIPTVVGETRYDLGYLRNPLVFCGTVGVLPRGSHPSAPAAGDLLVVLGGRTGRDGLRGATFSSLTMDGQTATHSGGAVQIGAPLTQKQLLEVVLEARDAGLYTAITDCGAGGLSSAVGEMGKALGAWVELDRVPLKYAGLAAWEIWLSEAQERMVLAVPRKHWPALSALAARHVCEATVFGHLGHQAPLTSDGPPEPAFELSHRGARVALVSADFLAHGLPQRRLEARWVAPPLPAPPLEEELAEGLAWRLREYAPRSDTFRRYDHEVGGGTVVKPLVGPGEGVASEGAVVAPLEGRAARYLDRQDNAPVPAFALAVALDPALGRLDPYVMAWRCVDEALRRVTALGGDPERTALLDNFAWGDPRRPDRLGALVRCVRGCHDAAVHYGAPFVSGKDSLNNEWTDQDGARHAIPPTLVITALAPVPDISSPRATGTPALVAPRDLLYLSGVLNDHPLASPDAGATHRYRRLHQAFQRGLVRGCRSVSRGGLALALAHMVLASEGLGLAVDLRAVPGGVTLSASRRAFCEGPGLHLIAVSPDDAPALEALFAGHHLTRIGEVTAERALHLEGVTLPLA